MKIRLSISQKLFLTGLLLHLAYLYILRFSPSDFRSMYLSDSTSLLEYTDNIKPDTRSYVESADNFLINGVFGEGKNADVHRTIGYPFVLVIFKYMFANSWYVMLVIFQCILAAINYPLIYLIGKKLFEDQSKAPIFAAFSMMILGTFFTRVYIVTTDLTFASFFLLGILFSLLSIEERKNYVMVFMAILTITFAGLIRPLLILYFIPNFLLLFWYARKIGVWTHSIMRLRIYFITAIILIGCNLSSYRNYRNYRVFTPTDVLGHNLLDYSVKNILKKEKKESTYKKMKIQINRMSNLAEIGDTQKDFFFNTVSSYPLSAMLYWTEVAINHILSPHWQRIGRSYGYYKRAVYLEDKLILQESSIMKKVHFIGMGINVLFFLLPFTLFLHNRFNKDRLFVYVVLSFLATLMGPTLIAGASERMRLPVEAFIILIAIRQLIYYVEKFKEIRADSFLQRQGSIKIFSKTIEYSIKMK